MFKDDSSSVLAFLIPLTWLINKTGLVVGHSLNPSFTKPFGTHIFYQGRGRRGRPDPLLSQIPLPHERTVL